MSKAKEMDRLRKDARRRGWTVEHSGKGLRWTHWSGAVVFSSLTPSCPFAAAKVDKQLKAREKEALTRATSCGIIKER